MPTLRLAVSTFILFSSIWALLPPGGTQAKGKCDRSFQRVEWCGAQDKGVTTLEPGKLVEGELKGGQSHSYQLSLAAGQYLGVVVEQRGVDVIVTLFGPDGNLVAEFDSEANTEGREIVSQVAEVAGSYRLTVQARQKAAAGRYDLRVVELRIATEKERALQEARKMDVEFARSRREGRNDEALQIAQRALAIRENALSTDNPQLTQPLTNLALAYTTLGDYVRAEPLLERALTITERLRGADHVEVAQALNNLAFVCKVKGDYKRAEPMYLRALEIREGKLKSDDPAIAQSLNNLAGLYADKSDYARATPLYERALAIRERVLQPEDPAVLASLNNLATVYQETGDLERAEPLYRRVLAISEKVLGTEHPNVARTLNNLAVLTLLKGDYAAAEPLYARALEIHEKTLGALHPNVAKALDSFAVLYDLKGEIPRAVELRKRSLEIREHHLSLLLATGSEEQKRAYLTPAALADETHITISLHARSAPDDPRAAEMALTLILQRKGRLLDAVTDSIGTLRRRLDPQDRALLEKLSSVNSQLANLVIGGQGAKGSAQYQEEIRRFEAERQRLEAAISSRSAEFRSQSQPVTMERVQRMIPEDAALVEITTYQPFDPKAKRVNERFGPARYVAYVLKPKGVPTFVDLGEAEDIDQNVGTLRQALCDPNRTDVIPLARALDEKVMRPVRKMLGPTRTVLLSPDGALNLIPFAALVDEQNRYLVEQYSFIYLTSGRDLLRLQVRVPSRQGPLVLAAPLFDQEGSATLSSQTATQRAKQTDSDRRSSTFLQTGFGSLPGTAAEAKALSKLLPGVRVLTGVQATEAALKQASGPSILHVATHGFFLPDQKSMLSPGEGSSRLPQPKGAPLENPLLRSGLALAGANRLQGGDGEDGILTALEAAGLDLWGTHLVVLSACETAVGDIRVGEGVYGLRRALTLAGAESQLMSLWQVSDEATRDLMVEYYKRLKAGEGRGDALRRVQLGLLSGKWQDRGGKRGVRPVGEGKKDASTGRSHPYYWGSFIQSGEWGNMEGKR